MTKSALVLCLILSFSARLLGQQSNGCENKVLAKSLEEKLSGIVVSQPPDNKQFYTSDWLEALVTLKDGRTISGEFLRYNGYLNKFIWLKKSTNQQIILNDENFRKVDLISGKQVGSGTFQRKNVKRWFDTDSVSVFLEVLVEGPISLFSQRIITNNQYTNEYTADYLYFIKVNNGPLAVIKPRKRTVMASLGTYKSSCKQALNKAKLGVTNEYDLVRALEYLNSSVNFEK